MLLRPAKFQHPNLELTVNLPGPPNRTLGQRLLAATLLTLTVLVIVLGGWSFAREVRTFERPGFELSDATGSLLVVALSGGLEEHEGGVRIGDRIALVNGERPVSVHEVEELLKRRSPSEITVLRGDELINVEHARQPLDIDAIYLLLALTGAIYLLIGSYTAIRELNGQVALFHLWCLATATIYMLTVTAPLDAFDKLFYVVEEAARLVLPALTVHFFLVFPQRTLGRTLSRLIPLLYVPGAAVLALELDMMLTGGALFAGAPTQSRLAALDRLELVLIVVSSLVAIGLLVRQVMRAQSAQETRQVAWIALGMAAGVLPFLFLYLLPFTLGFDVPTAVSLIAVAPLALIPLSFAYSLLRYRLWDITIIVRDLATYALTLLLGVFGFSLLSLLIERGIPSDFELTRSLLNLSAGLFVAGMLIPTKRGVSTTLHRFQYRGSFGRRRALSKLGEELLHERDLERLSFALLREIEEVLDIEKLNLYLTEGERLVSVRPELTPTTIELEQFSESMWKTPYQTFASVTLSNLDGSAPDELFLAGYRHVLPLLVRDRKVGVLLTGYHAGEVPLSSDDLMLVRQILDQASLAIENAQLIEQMQSQLNEVIELKQFNEEIIESSPAGLAVFDPDGRIVLANLAFAALVGLERSAVRRRQIADLLPVGKLPEPERGLVEARMTDHQGRERFLQLGVASFLGSSDESLRVLSVHDVTEQVAMERALEEKDRLAALGTMAAGVAHEVNTPLTGISSYAQILLAQTPEDDPRRAVLDKMERQTFRAARIVNTLLDFARTGTHEPKPICLQDIVNETVELLLDRIEGAGAKIVWEPGGADTYVSGNESELGQVFTNLIVNAIDAVGIEGVIQVRIHSTPELVAATVEDNGPGVASEDMNRIFRPFFSTKKSTGGTGLGLSISHEIVRRHGGELEVENLPEVGCRFTVLLPRAQPAEREGAVS